MKAPPITITIDTLTKMCPAVLEAWHKAETQDGGTDEHLIAFCTLTPDHAGEHRYGPWFDAEQSHVPFTLTRTTSATRDGGDE